MPQSTHSHSSRCAASCPAPNVVPPRCCPEPSADAELARVERRAGWARDAANGDPVAAAHAETEFQQALLAIELDLAERRADRLACGLDCLQSKIDAVRASSRRAVA